MSSIIKLNDEQIDLLVSEFKQNLSSQKFQSDEVKFNKTLKKREDKANLIFSDSAYIKIRSLVEEYSTEVQWHGLVRRLDNNTFYVYDILLFPQIVTSTTVDTDQEEYEKWLDTLNDEDFNHLRFHGHSHVNMCVSPSGVDMDFRKKQLNNFQSSNFDDNSFYVFLIINKRKEISGQIYDLQNNILYDTNDILIDVFLNNSNYYVSEFINNAKSLVKNETKIVTSDKKEQNITQTQSVPKIEKKKYSANCLKNSYISDYYDDYYDDYYGGR